MPQPDKATEVERLAAGWRRTLELLERLRRQREGEEIVQLESPEHAA